MFISDPFQFGFDWLFVLPPTSVHRYLAFDSNPVDRAVLRHQLAAHSSLICSGEAGTIADARHLLAEAEYDVVFLDTELLGVGTFELLPHLRPGARFVFVSRHQSQVIRAFEVNALDFLLKPVPSARLANTLRRLEPEPLLDRPAAIDLDDDTMGAGARRLRSEDVLRVRAGHAFRFAPVRQIVLISAQDNYSEVRFVSGPRTMIRRTMKFWENTLPDQLFLRVHRTQIVNLGHLTTCRRHREGHALLGLEGLPEPVTASRHRWNAIRSRLRIS